MGSCIPTWALLLLNSILHRPSDASSLAPVNQSTEQSCDNERVSNCFQSRLAATCCCHRMGEARINCGHMESLVPQLFPVPFLSWYSSGYMFQCPVEEHGYFCASLIFTPTTNGLNERHMQNARPQIMFSPVHGQEVNRRNVAQCH